MRATYLLNWAFCLISNLCNSFISLIILSSIKYRKRIQFFFFDFFLHLEEKEQKLVFQSKLIKPCAQLIGLHIIDFIKLKKIQFLFMAGCLASFPLSIDDYYDRVRAQLPKTFTSTVALALRLRAFIMHLIESKKRFLIAAWYPWHVRDNRRKRKFDSFSLISSMTKYFYFEKTSQFACYFEHIRFDNLFSRCRPKIVRLNTTLSSNFWLNVHLIQIVVFSSFPILLPKKNCSSFEHRMRQAERK